jgi:hypothetical protein
MGDILRAEGRIGAARYHPPRKKKPPLLPPRFQPLPYPIPHAP